MGHRNWRSQEAGAAPRRVVQLPEVVRAMEPLAAVGWRKMLLLLLSVGL